MMYLAGIEKSAAPLNVLLIEDNLADARLVREALIDAKDRIRVMLAHRKSLSEGLAITEEQRFDLVLLDLGLPDSRGLETFTRLHEARRELPIVVLSGNADFDLATEAVRLGAEDFLEKAQVTNGLVSALRNTIERLRLKRQIETNHRRLERINRVLRAIRSIGQLMLREKKPRALLQSTCERLAKLGHYSQAWAIFFPTDQTLRQSRNGRQTPRPLTGNSGGLAVATRMADLLSEQLEDNGEPSSLAALAQKRLPAPSSLRAICGLEQSESSNDFIVLLQSNSGYGVLGIQSDPRIHHEERALLDGVARDLGLTLDAIAGERARLCAEAETRVALEKAEGLFLSARAILDNNNFSAAAGSILREALALSHAEAAYVAIKRHDGSSDLVVRRVGENQVQLLTSPLPYSGLCAEATSSRQTLYENRLGVAAVSPCPPESLEQLLVAPLVVDDRGLGLLGLINKLGGFDESDARLAQSFAELTAIALHQSRTQSELDRSREKFRSMAEHVDVGLSLIDCNRQVREYNRQMHEWFPAIHQTAEHCHRSYLGTNGKRCGRCPTRETLSHGTVNEKTTELLIDGEARTFQIIAAPITDSSGALTGALETLKDVTEQVRSERERQRHLEFLQGLDQVNVALRTSTSPKKMIHEVLRVTVELLRCRNGMLLRTPREDLQARVVHYYSSEAEARGAAKPNTIQLDHEELATVAAAFESSEPLAVSLSNDHRARDAFGGLAGATQLCLGLEPQANDRWLLVLGDALALVERA